VVVPFAIACGRCFFCSRNLWSLCDNSNPNARMAEAVYGIRRGEIDPTFIITHRPG
jgi:threonine dehydrogenase-like Zn-dependent dehydrogenase